jgi:hypothetical protein
MGRMPPNATNVNESREMIIRAIDGFAQRQMAGFEGQRFRNVYR